MKIDRRLECQHPDEMHGPDAAGQASAAHPAPERLGRGFFSVSNPFGHVQCRETADTGDQISQQHQKRVMCAIKYDLPSLW
ncbi:hypothetical protein D3C81_948850 [compost metagenome]